MFGPIFLLEWKYAARRCRHFRLRLIYTVAVTLAFGFFVWAWWSRGIDPWFHHGPAWRIGTAVAGDYLPLFAGTHLLLILLVTPALAAASITDEKGRGTLTILFTTELTNAEIVLGKWLGQAVQVLVLAMPGVPFVVFLQAMCGLPPATVLSWAVESVLLALFLAALGLLASVWAQRTTTAVIIVYVLLAGALAGVWAAGLGSMIASVALVVPAYCSVGRESAPLVLATAGVTVTCLLLAAWRLRAASATPMTRRPRPRWRAWLARPPVGDAPLRWKERYVGEPRAIALGGKVPRWAWVALTLGLGLVAGWLLPGHIEAFAGHGLAMIFIVGLGVAMHSSTVITRERDQRTWEALLTTPLEPRDLVRGKLWGIIDSAKPGLLAYLAGTLCWAIRNGWWPTIVTGLCWLLTWGYLYFHAANGIYWSVRSSSSLKAMLYVVLTGWTAVLSSASFIVLGVTSALASLVMAVAGARLTDEVMVLIVLVFFVTPVCVFAFATAEKRLQEAEQYIAESERLVQGRGRWGHAVYPHKWTTAIARPKVKGAP